MQKRNSRLFFGYSRPFKPFYGHRSLLNPREGEIRGQGSLGSLSTDGYSFLASDGYFVGLRAVSAWIDIGYV